MFNNINITIDNYIYFYKFFILNYQFNQYLKGFISYNDYYNIYNTYYFNLIKVHNNILS